MPFELYKENKLADHLEDVLWEWTTSAIIEYFNLELKENEWGGTEGVESALTEEQIKELEAYVTAEDENYEKQQWHERRSISVLDTIIERWYEEHGS
tara:strand:- start:805 stop:1095 length:291 start_codon:yes stop_codon:yes gene_type:complete